MATYLVEFFLPRSTSDAGAELARRVGRVSERLRSEGVSVQLLQAVAVPGEEFCLCLFDADSPDDVDEVTRRAGLPTEGRPEPVRFLPVGIVPADPGGRMERTTA
jgi:hypothetical protein